MKTAQEWSDDRWDQFSNKVTLTQWIELIQEDAFESGLAKEMRRVADAVNGHLPKFAKSLRERADQLQPKDTCSKND